MTLARPSKSYLISFTLLALLCFIQVAAGKTYKLKSSFSETADNYERANVNQMNKVNSYVLEL